MKIQAEVVQFSAYDHPFFRDNLPAFRALKRGEAVEIPDDSALPPGVMVIEPTPQKLETDGRPRRQKATEPIKNSEET